MLMWSDVIYTLWNTFPKCPTISQMSYHCSKVNLKCVHQCINLRQKEINCLIFKTNCSSIEERFKKLGDGMQNKIGNNKHKSPIFENDFLSPSNKIH